MKSFSGIHTRDISGPGKVIPVEKTNGSPVYNFLPETNPEKVDVLYFAGCMTHLTPSIKNSMVKILDASGLNYKFY